MSIDEMVDAHFGMISKSQAAGAILPVAAPQMGEAGRGGASVHALLEFIDASKEGRAQQYTINVEDRVYRVFNPLRESGKALYRTLVLGSEGGTVQVRLYRGLSETVDRIGVCRGDPIMIRGAILDMATGTLKGTNITSITKTLLSRSPAITDLSLLRSGQKNVDVEGSVVEIGPARRAGAPNGRDSVSVSYLIIADGTAAIPVSVWGSSAAAAGRINLNRKARVEFCNVRSRNGGLELYAGDLSRVFELRS